MTDPDIHLIVRRTIRAAADRLFDAWTQPEQLVRWWGPEGMTCPAAEVDLREGGRYRLANEAPDGSMIWISGEFERITRPTELVYTWNVEPSSGPPERVTVRFEAKDGATEVVVIHERIASEAAKEQHAHGWRGCLEGLASLSERDPAFDG